MNSRTTASIVGAMSVAVAILSGCTNEEVSQEEATAFAATWSQLSRENQKTACWAITAQALPDQQAQAMTFLSDTFGKSWTNMSSLIEKKC